MSQSSTEANRQIILNHTGYRNFNREQAEQYLVGRIPGSFVLRPSSEAGHFSVSWLDNDNHPHHGLIRPVENGFEDCIRHIIQPSLAAILSGYAIPEAPGPSPETKETVSIKEQAILQIPKLPKKTLGWTLPPEQKDKKEREENAIKRVHGHPDFHPTKTALEAESTLDMTYSEKTIIIRNPNNTYECYIRIPPITFHKTYDPKKDEINSFLARTFILLRTDVQRKRNAKKVEQKVQDEKEVSASRESSMRQLSGSQVGLLQAVRDKYRRKLNELGGDEAVLISFKEYLESKYNEHFSKFLEFLEQRFKDLEKYKSDMQNLRDSTKDKKESEESKRKNSKTEEIKKLTDMINLLENQKKHVENAKKKFPDIFRDRKLPLDWGPELDDSFLNRAYFLNPYHTVLRYFQNPNPLIHPEARYAATTYDLEQDINIVTHAQIYPDSKENLALLWLAASDDSITPIKGFTTSSMKEFFTQAIYGIARGHNWDKVDAMSEGPEKQNYMKEMQLLWGQTVDNLEKDDPSCVMGVNQRLLDSIIGNPLSDRPETRRLDDEVVREYFRDILGKSFENYLNAFLSKVENPEQSKKIILEQKFQLMMQIKEWYLNKYVLFEKLNKEQQEFFEKFRLKPEEIKSALKELKARFGERVEWLEMTAEVNKRFSSAAHYFDTLARAPDPWNLSAGLRLAEMIENKISEIRKEIEISGKILKPATEPIRGTKDILRSFERKEKKQEETKDSKLDSPKL